jgi:prepilin-type N-terminal cleavage/methylation domain-containing protein
MHSGQRAARRQRHPRSQLGVTLLELTLVVAILGVIAVVVIPQLSTSGVPRLDLAAEIQAEAMRFARTEAMRRGEPVGFRQQNAEQRMRVFSLDTGTSPWTVRYDVYHPVSKQLWDISLAGHSFAEATTVASNKNFRGDCNTPSNVYFDTNGIARCADPETTLLERYEVLLTLGNHSRTVSLEGISGKVTIE